MYVMFTFNLVEHTFNKQNCMQILNMTIALDRSYAQNFLISSKGIEVLSMISVVDEGNKWVQSNCISLA